MRRFPLSLPCAVILAVPLAFLGASAAPRVLFVGDPTSADHAVDDALIRYLGSSGQEVRRGLPGEPPPRPADCDLVLVSGTVHPHSLSAGFRDLATPLITWQPGVLEDLRMTGREEGRDYGTDAKRSGALYLYLVNAPHPLQAGLPNGILDVFTDTQKTLSWGRPGAGADVIATLPGEPAKAVLFGYDRGVLMNGDFAAPARRALLFLNPTTFRDLSEQGTRLFSAAVTWALAEPTVPRLAAGARRLLFVRWKQLAAKFVIADDHAIAHLRSLGFVVTEAEPMDCLARAAGQEMVVVSSTVEAHDVEGKFRDSPLPVVTWEANIYDDMRMTGWFQETDYGCDLKDSIERLWLARASHPLAAGVPNGWIEPYRAPSLIRKIDWGAPAPSAQILAMLPGEPRKAAIFAYEKGARMAGDFDAPGRRVGLFLHSESFDQLNDPGLRLFDAAILWASQSPP